MERARLIANPTPAKKPGCLRRLAIAFGILLTTALLTALAIFLVTEVRLNRVYAVSVEPFSVPLGEDSIARGEHLALVITGCQDCHGSRLQGRILEDDAALGQIVATNLTAGRGGIGSAYSDADWIRFMRHGIGRDGKPLVLVSSLSLFDLSQADMAALIAYMRALPPVNNVLPETRTSFLGRLFILLEPSSVPALVLDHNSPFQPAPEPGVNIAYGEYLATQACIGCHRADFAGGASPGAGRNLTGGGELATWSERDFIRTLRTGLTPDLKKLDNDMMPYGRLGKMTDDEMRAIWLYLRTLPAVQNATNPGSGLAETQ